MSEVQSGDTIRVHYTGELEDGMVFDSSEGGEPLEFTVGQEQVIPGFEEAAIGMIEGEIKEHIIPMEKAYGPRNEEMVVQVGHDAFTDDVTPEVGMRFNLRQKDGQPVPVVITEVDEDSVTLDANHPLSGLTLVFKIELVEIV